MSSPVVGSEHYVARKDGKVYYLKVGNGEPLVLLHDAGRSGWIWRKVIGEFAKHFTCYNIDMPGFDHSDIPPRQYSLEDFSQATLDVMDHAGIQQTNIVAYRTGAMVAIVMAGLYPQRVKGIVVEGLPYWNKAVGRLVFEKHLVPVEFTDHTSYDVPVRPLTTWEESVKANPRLEREVWEKTEEINRKSRRWITIAHDSAVNYDMELAGPKVKAPTLLLYMENDPMRRGERKAKEGIPNSVLKVVPGGSDLHDEQPQVFAKLAVEFLKGR